MADYQHDLKTINLSYEVARVMRLTMVTQIGSASHPLGDDPPYLIRCAY